MFPFALEAPLRSPRFALQDIALKTNFLVNRHLAERAHFEPDVEDFGTGRSKKTPTQVSESVTLTIEHKLGRRMVTLRTLNRGAGSSIRESHLLPTSIGVSSSRPI